MVPNCYTLLRPLQVIVVQGNGSVTMRYEPRDREMGTIKVVGGSIDVAELLMRSELAEAWRKYLVMRESSPHVNGNVAAIGQELSDFVK